MPDVLILARDNKSCFDLEELARKHDFRVKVCMDRATAADWLKTRMFDLLLVDSSVPLYEQQELAGLLWQADPVAQMISFNLDAGAKINLGEARLFGAELAVGEKALPVITSALEQIKRDSDAKQRFKSEDFRIMVVEDLDSPRDIICSFIETLGYPLVSGEHSASSAMKELESDPGKYSCVITDIRMPEISGKELIEFIRLHSKLQGLPVIVLTAYGTGDCLVDCLKAGASGFLVKPPKKKDLLRELSRAIRIAAKRTSPRLASPDEADLMREILMQKGLA
ncbi:MAG: hypothetical protein DCC75_10270 [Proteobacteria bacterium]|nr:MAG: hypothetical protein DCC75_10270 [Pseudomonadota bacterium]